MPTFREYCDLDSVKRLLRSAGPRESRVRFSEAYKDLKADEDNAGSVGLTGVSFNSAYGGHEEYTFTFTDSTSFDVVSDVLGAVGSGERTSLFTISNTFSVPVANWTGGSVANDKIYISSNSDMSDDDADGFIVDARRYINAQLETSFGDLDSVPFLSDSSLEIPEGIVYACMRYAAYEIWSAIFAGVEIDEASAVGKWKKMADSSVGQYVSGKGTGPRWRARSSLITEVGVVGVGEGKIITDPLTNPSNEDFKR